MFVTSFVTYGEQVKIVVLGDLMVGKTSIIKRLTKNKFSDKYFLAMIFFDYQTDGGKIKFLDMGDVKKMSIREVLGLCNEIFKSQKQNKEPDKGELSHHNSVINYI